MEQNVQKEINDVKHMVQNWYDFYLSQANGSRYDQIHVEEFQEVCDQQLSPYLQRLAECKYLDKKELSDLYLFVGTRAQDLSLEIAKVKPEIMEKPKCETAERMDGLDLKLSLINKKLDWILTHAWGKNFTDCVSRKTIKGG